MKITTTIDISPEEVSQLLGDTSKIAAEIQKQIAASIAKEMTRTSTDIMTSWMDDFWKSYQK